MCPTNDQDAGSEEASTGGSAEQLRPGAHPAVPRRVHLYPRRGWSRIDFAELWRHRELAWMFAIRDVKVRYKQTFFGYAWAVVVPSVQVLVFSVVFGTVLGVDEKVNEAAGRRWPYPLLLLSGQVVWNFFKLTVDGASLSLQNNAHIVRKIYVPRLLLPIAAVGKPAVDTAVAFVLMLGLCAWYAGDPAYDIALTPRLLLCVPLLMATAIPAVAVGLLTSAITVHYRDLQYVLPFAVNILFYATPVLYTVDTVPEQWAWAMYLNPVAGLVEAHRACAGGAPVPWAGLGVSLGVSVAVLVPSALFFARAERQFADVA